MEQSDITANSSSDIPEKRSSRRGKTQKSSVNTSHGNATWSIDDYGKDMTGAAAAKLHDSAVAPVVAAARGYWRASTQEEYDRWAKYVGIKKTQLMYLSVAEGVVGTDDDGFELDGLIMPWYSIKYTKLQRDGEPTD